MKRAALIGLLVVLLLFCSNALAVGRVTPEAPDNPEIRATFGAWVESTLVPYLVKDTQDKWSPSQCRQVVEMAESAGFFVADEWKDVLYRTKREHRLSGLEAFHYLVNSQYGNDWDMTVEDYAWIHYMAVLARLLSEKRYYLPTEQEGTYADVMTAAKTAIVEHYGITEDKWKQYDIAVSFMSGGTENGGTIKYWQVIVLTEWPYISDFVYTYSPSTGEVELLDERK